MSTQSEPESQANLNYAMNHVTCLNGGGLRLASQHYVILDTVLKPQPHSHALYPNVGVFSILGGL
jgi:hypothetical protein